MSRTDFRMCLVRLGFPLTEFSEQVKAHPHRKYTHITIDWKGRTLTIVLIVSITVCL